MDEFVKKNGMIPETHIANAISTTTGVYDFNLQMSDVLVSANEVPVLGEVQFT